MATYFPGSNIQADTMQTLYLMNPDYAGYTDLPASGNMVLINHSAGNAFTSNNMVGGGHAQQHFIGIPFPPPQHSVGAGENSPAAHQGVNSSLLSPRLGNHGYNAWRNVGNDPTPNNNQSLPGQLNNFANVGQQSVSEISPTGMRRVPMSSIQQQQLGMNPSRLGLQSNQSHASTGHGQGLSLSLSPQQLSSIQLSCFQNQPTESEVNCASISQATSEENMNGTNKITNKWTGSLSSRDGMLGTGFPNTLHGLGVNKQLHHDSRSTGTAEPPNSLLGSKYLKPAQQLLDEVASLGKGAKSDSAKHHKSQTWVGAVSDKENTLMEAGGKDGVSDAPTTGLATSADETNNKNATELTPAERQELQIKKTKLVTMLDEVDRRYRQYYHQMQIVVSSFEAAASFGAAKTYTALALQTISRHFRCLRDAITGQIRVTSKSLGEDDLTSGKGETSRLQFVDQQLRQQRALQQLGMIQQHAWRPQRGLPERSVSILRAWLFEHFLHPGKVVIKLSNSAQEGVYVEQNSVSNGGFKSDHASDRMNGKKITMGMVGTAESQVFHEVHKEDMGQGLLKKARNGTQDSASLVSPNMSMDVDLKSEETGSEYIFDNNKFGSERHTAEDYNLVHNKLVHPDNSGSFGSYQFGGLSRYGQESFAPKFSGIGGVSLTLGLQHCDDLSLSGTQQSYCSSQGLGSGRRHGLGNDSDDYCNINEASVVRAANNYENISIQNRKRFATQLVHDFVA